MKEIIGNIHSVETCGTVDGPGIRFVVFTQGCPMRCLYCHNPDTWSTENNQQIPVSSILEQYESVKEFCKGGITVTGGEPLMQIDFVTELFKSASKKGIHTALDTSGILFNPKDTKKIDELLKYTALVLLDIKHIDDNEHKKLTGHSNKNILEFAKYLPVEKKGVQLVDALVNNGLAESKKKAREFIKQGAITINGEKVKEDITVNQTAMVKKGKNKFLVVK